MSTTVPDRVLGVSDTSELLTDTSIAWAKTLTANATYAILVVRMLRQPMYKTDVDGIE
jgi:hypothetical protein